MYNVSKDKVMQTFLATVYQTVDDSNTIRQVIKKVFVFYVSFGDRINNAFLKGNRLQKMMHDSFMFDRAITHKSLDLLFAKHSKNRVSLDFDAFLSLLIDIALKKYPSKSVKESFNDLFKTHIKPLYCNLYKETEVGELEVIFKEPLTKEILILMKKIAPVFGKLHRAYFECEYRLKENR